MDLQTLLDKYEINAQLEDLLDKWREPHRHYHNISHLDDLLLQIRTDLQAEVILRDQAELLALVALFHDIFYDATKRYNEQRSATYFLGLCRNLKDENIREIATAIEDTAGHSNSTPLATQFNKYDMAIVEQDLDRLLIWEHGIYHEYKIFGDMAYKMGRLQFLHSLPKKYPHNAHNLEALIAWVMNKY